MRDTLRLLSRMLPQGAMDDAVLDAIVLSACSDGMTGTELEALAQMASELPSLAGRDQAAVTERIRQSFERVERDGLEGRLRAFGGESFDDRTRRRIFLAAALVQYADGRVTASENEFLLDLSGVLGLDDATVADVLADIERNLET